MNNSQIKVGIICPIDVEYKICKEELKLVDETERTGRFIFTLILNSVTRIDLLTITKET